MSKQIVIRDAETGKAYTLEYTRRTIEMMEKNGFMLSEFTEKPVTNLPALFAGAFLANHKFIKKETVDNLYSQIKDKQSLIEKLAEMYNEPIQALFEDPADNQGNVTWEANW